MKKLLLIILCNIITSYSLQAQFLIEYNISYASYDMKDMKDLLHTIELSEDLQKFGIRNVDNFPAYIAHTANIGYKLNNHEFGIKNSFYTTGGKLSVADYSGAINIELIANGFREGVYYKNHFYSYKYSGRTLFSFWGEISPAVIISELKMKTKVREVEKSITLEDYNFTKIAFAVLPQIGTKYHFTEHISLDMSIGYELSFGGKFNDLYSSPRANWSGIRINGGIGYKF